jgi:hypothetical protein
MSKHNRTQLDDQDNRKQRASLHNNPSQQSSRQLSSNDLSIRKTRSNCRWLQKSWPAQILSA